MNGDEQLLTVASTARSTTILRSAHQLVGGQPLDYWRIEEVDDGVVLMTLSR
ncbi:hypothetical protein [Streptomyces fradiae]|uniref:hypothetical protein n=1 Tax=Streptomyces fradiae TaxID=1906 RepID=UPI00398850FE